MRARFIHEGEECRVFGVVFVRMEWTDISHLDPDHQRKLAANPTFHVDDEETGEAVGETPKASPKPASRPRARGRATAAR